MVILFFFFLLFLISYPIGYLFTRDVLLGSEIVYDNFANICYLS